MVFEKIILVVVLFQYSTQNALSENIAPLNSADDNEIKDVDGRRNNVYVIKTAATGGGLANSQMQSKSYASSSSSSSSASSGGVSGWVSESHNSGTVVSQPPVIVHGPIQNQQGCALGSGQNILTASEQASLIQQQSANQNSHAVAGGSAINTHVTNGNSYQIGQNGFEREREVAVEHVGGQSSTIHKTTAQVVSNKINENTIVSGNNQQVNTVYEDINNIHHGSVFRPENNFHKIAVIESGDEVYANVLTGQQTQNSNVMVSSDSNAHNIVAIPITRPHFGQVIVHGYRPNMQYYLSQIESSNMYNPSKILRVPSFLEQIKSDQVNLKLSEEQLNSYKQYLIQSGLIKLKPYQLIFSEQFRPKLKTLQWMVVPLNTNFEYCKQQCGYTFGKNTLYSTLAEHAGNMPIKLLVPILRVRSGVKITRAQTITEEENHTSDGLFRKAKDSSAHVNK